MDGQERPGYLPDKYGTVKVETRAVFMYQAIVTTSDNITISDAIDPKGCMS